MPSAPPPSSDAPTQACPPARRAGFPPFSPTPPLPPASGSLLPLLVRFGGRKEPVARLCAAGSYSSPQRSQIGSDVWAPDTQPSACSPMQHKKFVTQACHTRSPCPPSPKPQPYLDVELTAARPKAPGDICFQAFNDLDCGSDERFRGIEPQPLQQLLVLKAPARCGQGVRTLVRKEGGRRGKRESWKPVGGDVEAEGGWELNENPKRS